MVDDLVYEVRSESIKANISHANAVQQTKTKAQSKKPSKSIIGKSCPKCDQGQLVKGGTAYGCTAYKSGCNFILPFKFNGKKISESQYLRLLDKGCTVNLKGFKIEETKVEGLLRFDEAFELVFEPKKSKPTMPDQLVCPKCKHGHIIKGKTAYGCSDYKNGCDFKFLYTDVKLKANGQVLTKDLVYNILKAYDS